MTATAEANDAIRFAFALTTAVANGEDELANELLPDADIRVTLGVTQTALRYALEQAEERMPGFRDEVLAFIGAAFAEDVYEDGELDT